MQVIKSLSTNFNSYFQLDLSFKVASGLAYSLKTYVFEDGEPQQDKIIDMASSVIIVYLSNQITSY